MASSFSGYPPKKYLEPTSAISDTSEAFEDADISPGEPFPNHVFSPTVNGSAKELKWQAQKRDRLPWSNGLTVSGPRRGRQKSLSEAIRTIKDRRASVSENAHEIAEALKAPVSPRLVVGVQQSFAHTPCLWVSIGSLRVLVHDLDLLQRFFQSHPYSFSIPSNAHTGPIHVRFLLVLRLLLARIPLHVASDSHSSSQIQDPAPFSRAYYDHPSLNRVPNWRSHP